MPKFFIATDQIKDNKITIQNEDVNHIKNVLRAKIGDNIKICDYQTSKDYTCEIVQLEEKNIYCKILKELNSNIETNVKVSIFQGIPKSDKMELIIQKSVELGAFDITPVEMKRCVVKLNEKDQIKKIDRWRKISEVAAKQCGRNIIPKVNHIISISELNQKIKEYDLMLVAYENEKENTIKHELLNFKENIEPNTEIKIAIVIGPEGGLEDKDVELLKHNGAKIITLGNRILRTETVALNVLSVIMYELEQE